MPDIFADLKWRGLIHQTTDDENLPTWLASGQRTLYAGFDPTATSLHVGHLLPLIYLRRFQQAGHRVIALVGGATGMIGDPSGKSEERNLLSQEALEANVAGIRQQMEGYLDFGGENPAILLNNYDWMRDFTYLDFLRDVGKHFPVNVMMAKDSVRSRLEREGAGISYSEFSYMLLQAYDFVYLNRNYGCELQIGGSDQWGNITAGIDLARRMHGVQLYGITCPLLLDSTGKKMGKTASGDTVWLSPERTSPYKFYQYWINVPDADIGKCLRFFTMLPYEEIEAIEQADDPRFRQRRLAEEMTKLVHGEAGLQRAQLASEILFGREISGLSDAELNEIFADVPSHTLPRTALEGEGVSVAEAFTASGLAKSNSEVRRTVEQGGAYVNNRRVPGFEYHLTAQDLASETVMVLRSGKKKYALLRFE